MAKASHPSRDLFNALRDVGLADDNTTRVVIDIKAGEFPRVHVERIGDNKLINVIQTLDGVEITREEG